jgi:polar amino acid transport system substrate-binding protein
MTLPLTRRRFSLGSAAPLALAGCGTVPPSPELVRGGQADIGFYAVDQARSQGIRFSAPYVQIEGAYLVRSASPWTDDAQVDRVGTRFMVGRGSAYDLYLSRELAAFVEQAKASGFVAQALQRHGIQGATVAPKAA